jgi:hypothetical protein
MLLVSIFAAATNIHWAAYIYPRNRCHLSLQKLLSILSSYPWVAAINPCCIGHLFMFISGAADIYPSSFDIYFPCSSCHISQLQQLSTPELLQFLSAAAAICIWGSCFDLSLQQLLFDSAAAAIYPCSSRYVFQLELLSINAGATIYPSSNCYLSRQQSAIYSCTNCYLSLQQLLSISQPATSYPCSCYISIPAAPLPPPT